VILPVVLAGVAEEAEAVVAASAAMLTLTNKTGRRR